MGRFLAIIAMLLIVLLGAAFIVPAVTDWNAYRPDIEEAASAILGRQIHIAGNIEIEILPELHLRASKVSTIDGPGDGATMSAAAVDLSLSLQALLSGHIEANSLKLLRPVVQLDFSKPVAPRPKTEVGALSIAPGVNSVEIEDGRISIFSKDYGGPDALALTKIDGTIAAASGGGYRFGGRVWQKDRALDVKLLVSANPDGPIRVTGNIVDTASKIAAQADGVLTATAKPYFEGAILLNIPQAASLVSGIPFELSLKSNARFDLAGASLTDLALTVDPQNRAQVLSGSAEIAFVARTANVVLQAHALDLDSLSADTLQTGDWSELRRKAETLLWVYPEFGLHLSLSVDQLQLKGEPLEVFKFDGIRKDRQWDFREVAATLPGTTAAKFAGTLTAGGQTAKLSGAATIEGQNLARFERWIAAPTLDWKAVTASNFALKAQFALSGNAVAFDGVSGTINGASFSGNLHAEQGPVRKLQLVLAADSLDAGSLLGGPMGVDITSFDGATVFQAISAQFETALFGNARGFDLADIDISSGTLHAGTAEAKDLSIHVKSNQDLLTISNVSFVTAEGLTFRGDGILPLRGVGQGRFDARINARSAQALLQGAMLLGFDAERFGGRRLDDLAPAMLTIGYGADAQAGTAWVQLTGTLGVVRAEGRVQLKGVLNEWQTGIISGHITVSTPEGNKLLAQFFPSADFAPGASLAPGVLTLRVNGSAQRLETSGALKAGPLQIQLDGVADARPQSFTFSGRASASSQTPEQFLPATLLALFGGEPKASLRIETSLALTLMRLEAEKLRVESPRNVVTGRLALDASATPVRLEADLRTDQISLAPLLGYFLVPAPPDRSPQLTPAVLSAPLPVADIWSSRPFAPDAFQNKSAKVTLAAKTLKLSDALVLLDAQARITVEDGRLEIQKLEGKTFGGDLSASVTLEPKGTGVTARTSLTLANVDAAQLPTLGTPAVLFGRATIRLWGSGQGVTPRGLVSALQGRGVIAVSDGEIAKFSPSGVQKLADELTALQQPPSQEAITKKILEALQSSDFKFQRRKIPIVLKDGMIEIRRASFRGRDGTVRVEAYLDLSSMHVDSIWQAGIIADPRTKWPPVKFLVSGPLRELGGRPRTPAADEFARAVLVRKMEGDMARLEGLNRSPQPAAAWTATQEPIAKLPDRKKPGATPPAAAPPANAAPASDATVKTPIPAGTPNFEARMRDALRGNASPDAR